MRDLILQLSKSSIYSTKPYSGSKKLGKNCCKSAPFSLSYEGTRQMRVPSIHSSNQGSTGSE
ncbi:hypothetical protein DMQ92_26905 [Klebsiella pneumoniae]|nr:hypothetical protein DMQ92_26905 [Klebsiella pneumoniae]